MLYLNMTEKMALVKGKENKNKVLTKIYSEASFCQTKAGMNMNWQSEKETDLRGWFS